MFEFDYEDFQDIAVAVVGRLEQSSLVACNVCGKRNQKLEDLDMCNNCGSRACPECQSTMTHCTVCEEIKKLLEGAGSN